MDVDPNYDPSYFLLAGLPNRQPMKETEDTVYQGYQEQRLSLGEFSEQLPMVSSFSHLELKSLLMYHAAIHFF